MPGTACVLAGRAGLKCQGVVPCHFRASASRPGGGAWLGRTGSLTGSGAPRLPRPPQRPAPRRLIRAALAVEKRPGTVASRWPLSPLEKQSQLPAAAAHRRGLAGAVDVWWLADSDLVGSAITSRIFELCTWQVLRVPCQYIGTQTGLLGPGGDGGWSRPYVPLTVGHTE